MVDTDYVALLEKAKLERAQAGAERFELENRIARLDAIIMALRSIVEQPVIDPAKGITEGIKAALKIVAPKGLFPTTLRAQLEKAGFDFSGQANSMASIHAILKRLRRKGYVKSQPATPDGRVGWVWAT